MKLWLDDLRPSPVDWEWCTSAEKAIIKIAFAVTGEGWTHASLDHDLGPGMQGVHLLDWMANHSIWPTDEITIHSMNPVGRETMLRLIDRYGPYDLRPSLFVRRNSSAVVH
jgi:hypothetical protein